MIRLLSIVAACLIAVPALAQSTLESVRANDVLRCGVNTGLAGFSLADERGRWSGIDVDYCRAVAAAVLGNPEKVDFVPLSAQARFTALQSGEIDILSRNTTWTLSREAALGLTFVGVLIYDGQAFMVPSDLGVSNAMELDGAAICVQMGTTTEVTLTDWFRANDLRFSPVVYENLEEARQAFFGGRCDVFTSDASQLAAIRTNDAPNPADYMILPDAISKEPLGPAVRSDDPEWARIARWVLFALVNAEELGVSSGNVQAMYDTSEVPAVRRLLGKSGDLGMALGLSNDWAFNAILGVGNYGEIYDRNVGRNSPLKLERGLNALWTEGGVLFVPPVR